MVLNDGLFKINLSNTIMNSLIDTQENTSIKCCIMNENVAYEARTYLHRKN